MAKAKRKSKAKAQTTTQTLAKPVPLVTDNIYDTIAAALVTANQPVLMKVCRLCGTKDGPFLNIFDPEQITAKKIDQLMPFKVAENDELPHKICFRCSAKVEELYEFIQKCIKTQENLHDSSGKASSTIFKNKTRSIWEEQLNKSNMTNDDICDALIKKAMAGIKDIPASLPAEESKPPVEEKKAQLEEKKAQVEEKKHSDLPLAALKQLSKTTEKPRTPTPSSLKDDDDSELTLKQIKTRLSKSEQVSTRTRRANNSEKVLPVLEDEKPKPVPILEEEKLKPSPLVEEKKPKQAKSTPVPEKVTPELVITEKKLESSPKVNRTLIDFLTFDYNDGPNNSSNKKTEEVKTSKKEEIVPKEPPPKPFNIMDHVCIIKVNGVGVLFQCKLCNRNFLKKEVVVTHSCAKNGIPKTDFTSHVPPPEPPKIPSVKYINTKLPETKKPIVKPTPVEKPVIVDKPVIDKPVIADKPVVVDKPVVPEVKSKPRIGPASKTKRETNQSVSNPPAKTETLTQLSNPSVPPTAPKVIPVGNTLPSMNGRFRLIPGPNNTFQLIEDQSQAETQEPTNKPITKEPSAKSSRKRKSDIVHNTPKPVLQNNRSLQEEVIEVEDEPVVSKQSSLPYPVGLFQTALPPPIEPPIFTTPAMKKQSYTIVQTGNPSKLLISTKAQPQVEETSKKKQKRAKGQRKAEVPVPESKEPFSVTMEDTTQPKDGFFTFINVDPLLQPSYVLPTNNIIQESQITTSTSLLKTSAKQSVPENKEKDKYSCNMCPTTFSREKKLLAHIQSHYSKMDEEDQMRAEKVERKRQRRI